MKQVKNASRQVVAAVAYVGTDGPRILPLKKGDILVCNASDLAIKQGSTSANALAKYSKRRVRIYNQERLHGKVIVLSKKVFIGSANASKHSMEYWSEAVIESTDLLIIEKSRSYVLGLASAFKRLDRKEIEKLQRIVITRPPPLPKPPLLPLSIPTRVPRLWLFPMEYGFNSKSADRLIYKEKRSVVHDLQDDGLVAGVEGMEFVSEVIRGVKVNDWWIGVYESGRLQKPRQVLKVSYVTKRKRVVWSAIPKTGSRSVYETGELSMHKFDWNDTNRKLLKERATTKLLGRF